MCAQPTALYPDDQQQCTFKSNHFVKFADYGGMMVGLTSRGDKYSHRSEAHQMTLWCRDSNLTLNIGKTKEIVVDFRRAHTQQPPLTIDGSAMEQVSSTRFLGVHMSDDLSWMNNTTTLAKKAQQRLYFLCKLKGESSVSILRSFYHGMAESILTSRITV